jgi:hypothetical protein
MIVMIIIVIIAIMPVRPMSNHALWEALSDLPDVVCMHIYIGLLPSGSIDAIACCEVCVCVSSTAGADGDRLFSLVLPSGTFAADRFQTIVKYFAHAA